MWQAAWLSTGIALPSSLQNIAFAVKWALQHQMAAGPWKTMPSAYAQLHQWHLIHQWHASATTDLQALQQQMVEQGVEPDAVSHMLGIEAAMEAWDKAGRPLEALAQAEQLFHQSQVLDLKPIFKVGDTRSAAQFHLLLWVSRLRFGLLGMQAN